MRNVGIKLAISVAKTTFLVVWCMPTPPPTRPNGSSLLRVGFVPLAGLLGCFRAQSELPAMGSFQLLILPLHRFLASFSPFHSSLQERIQGNDARVTESRKCVLDKWNVIQSTVSLMPHQQIQLEVDPQVDYLYAMHSRKNTSAKDALMFSCSIILRELPTSSLLAPLRSILTLRTEEIRTS